MAFALARKLEDYDSKKKVTILYEVIETAPSETVVIDGVKYQKSLNFTGKIDNYFSEYLEILNYYKELTMRLDINTNSMNSLKLRKSLRQS